MKKIRVVFIILYIVMILYSFYSSLQDSTSSGNFSMEVTSKIVFYINKVFPNWNINFDIMHSIVRVLIGHYMYHAVIGIIGFIAYSLYELGNKRVIIVSLICAGLTSIISEFLQLFAKGRCFEIKDILINLSGFLTGIVICEIIYLIKSCKSKSKKTN